MRIEDSLQFAAGRFTTADSKGRSYAVKNSSRPAQRPGPGIDNR